MDSKAYISQLKKCSLAERQMEIPIVRQKLMAAAVYCDFPAFDYYAEALQWLMLFNIVDEGLDIPKRIFVEPEMFLPREE